MSEPDPPSSDRHSKRLADRYSAKPMGAAYQGAMESVFSIVIGVLLGWWADSAFETSPWGVVTGATIGFGAFVLRLSRLGAALDAPVGEPRGDDDPPEGEPGPEATAAKDAKHEKNEGQDGTHDRPR